MHPQLSYREAYHKEKHLYTTVLDTYDYARCHNFKYFFSNVRKNKEEYTSFYKYLHIRCFAAVNCILILLFFFPQKNYTAAWDKIKAKSYQIPHDSHALLHAKYQKIVLSNVNSTFNSIHNLLVITVEELASDMSLTVDLELTMKPLDPFR